MLGRLPILMVALAAATACGHAAVAPSTSPKAGSVPIGGGKGKPSSGSAAIDATLREEWKRAGVVPAQRADDATFLRRAYVDIVGTVPPPDVTVKFLADTAPDKRARLVDTLLASPDYAEHWMNYWDDALMGADTKGNNVVDRVAFREWLQRRFAANAGWNRIATELLTATGQNGTGGPKVKGPAISVASETDTTEADATEIAAVNGAVNWTLRFDKNPQDFGGSASRVLLGVQIQCAQCHDHKTESWKQDDFRRFSSAFFRSKVEPIDRGKPMGSVLRVQLVDAPTPAPKLVKNAEIGPLVRAKATALDGTDLEKGAGTRKALAAWMTAKDNKWFARAFVNRMWGHFLGRGFFDPVDDIRPSNPPSAPDLLDRVAADWVAHDFDIAWLVRTLCATEAYNLAAQRPGDPSTSDPENKLWARFHLVPLGPEELLNALFRVTELEKTAEKAGIKDVEALRTSIVRQYGLVFDTDEEADAPDYSGTITQALALLNGALVTQGSRALPGSAVAELASGSGTDAEKIDILVLRTLARRATAEERERWTAYIAGADVRAAESKSSAKEGGGGGRKGALARLSNKRARTTPKVAAYEDIFWALLNSSEFSFNH
jgi:hypothetical protein